MNPHLPSPSPWTQLQTDLRDLAFVLDRQGSHAAADLASTVAVRIGELVTAETEPRHADPRSLLN